MIRTKKELKFYIMADRMMNRGYFKPSFVQKLKDILLPDYTMQYLVAMRKLSYYSQWGGVKYCISMIYYYLKYRRLGMKLGFSIGRDVFGYGLVIPHYGTIVVGASNRCGNYCVLHTSTCISDNGKEIGNALYLATGAKMTSKCKIGDNVSVGANSVVNKDFEEGNVMIAGAPARIINSAEPWYVRDGKEYALKVEEIEKLKETMRL